MVRGKKQKDPVDSYIRANSEPPKRPKRRRLITLALFSGSIAELMHPPASQIPFLDGLRSIAVLLVISGHFSYWFAEAHGQNRYSRLPFVANGWIGVDLFFVLSGFFIGSQLWKELKDRGSIEVGRFVMRRGFRIWPLYYFTYFCVLTFALTLGYGAAAKEYGWSDLIFITNFHNRGLVLGSWSLCIEEQFYIVAPLALYFLARHLRSIRQYRPLLWGLFLSVVVLRAIVWTHATGHFFGSNPQLFAKISYNSLTHCDGLIIGLIISNLWVARDKPALKAATPWVLTAVAVVLMIGLHRVQKEVFDFTVLALLFGSLVWLGLQSKIGLFNSRLFYWISRLSFGMYLNHEYMCPWVVGSLLPKLPFATRLPVFTNLIGIALITLFSAGIALATFCLVEHPFLQMRKAVLGRHEDNSASDSESLRSQDRAGVNVVEPASTRP
jgi:peptidoglycan/LPS O-acetylase OafA/YrhL